MSKRDLFSSMMNKLKTVKPGSWDELDHALSEIQQSSPSTEEISESEFNQILNKGVAFLTFDYGIDGVSIEISKYAQSLQELSSEKETATIHLIGGDFFSQADSVLKPEWKRFLLEGANGWSKWDNGKWFSKLFYEDMPENNQESVELVKEIWNQAVSLSKRLGFYLAKNDISLMIPVNISSNPGNLALAVGAIIVSEAMGIYVLNSNHDFYWEGGKPASQRKSTEAPGPRDHFFKNLHNCSFYSLFEKIYPWNGQRWVQVNINRLQSDKLIEEYGFSKNRVYEISTSLSDKFFNEYKWKDIKSVRLRMAHILSNGHPIIDPIPVKQHFSNLKNWMLNQKPVVCAAKEGLSLDLTSEQIIYYLQPTRIIGRKRIEKDWQLIGALLQYPPFRKEFEKNIYRKIVLHITGPVPIEHQTDLETVLNVFKEVVSSVPDSISDRLFIAFSVGNEDHPCFADKGFQSLCIEDIYRLATAILFPSETEGRGLPISEASASEVPIVCSRYFPEEVFADAVGEGLSKEKQIQYTLFPEESFPESFLMDVMELSIYPEKIKERIAHNRNAARLRYGKEIMGKIFTEILNQLSNSK